MIRRFISFSSTSFHFDPLLSTLRPPPPKKKQKNFSYQATSVAWSCSAHRLASGGIDGCVKIWAPDRTRPGFNANLQQQQAQNPTQPAERPVAELRLAGGASPAAAAPPSAAAAPAPSRARPPRVNRLAWHPRLPDVLAVASDDGATVRLFDARSGEPCRGGGGGAAPSSSSSSSKGPSLVASFAPPSPVPRCAAISLAWCPPPGGGGGGGGGEGGGKRENLVAVGTDADVISFFDAATGRLLALLPPPSPGVEVNEAVFSLCGRVFARAVGTHGAVELFSVDELLDRGSPASPPRTASDWRQLRAPAAPFATLRGHTSTVFALSAVAAGASAAGEGGGGGGSGGGSAGGPAAFLLASGGADGAAVVWDIRFGAPLATCGAFDHQVKSVSLGGGWRGAGGPSPSGAGGAGAGSMIAYAGEGDSIVVDDWTLSAASGSFLPPRDPTAPHSKGDAGPTRPYPLRVFVPRVESVAWAPAVACSSDAPSSSAAAGPEGNAENGDGDALSSRRSSKRPQQQSNAGALAFVRCIPAGGIAQQRQGGRGGVGEVIGAVGLFAPSPPPSGAR